MKQGWELKTLKDVGAIFSGNSINAKIKEEKYSGLSDGLPYVATKDIGYDSIINYKNGIKIPYDESGSFKVAPKNSVLICAEGGSAGRKIGRLAQDVCFVNKLFAITPDNEITSKYLYYWYKSNAFKEEFNSRLTGLIGGVSKRKFETIPIPIPPLEEQKQIVAKLDQCFEAIDKAKVNAAKNLENTKELFQSKLNDIFSQKGEGWVEKTFEELSSRIGDGLHGTPKYDEYGKYYFINGNNLNDGVIEIKGNTKRVNKEEFEKYKKELTGNTVLISINGTLGKVAFYNNEPVILGKSACYINFNDEVNKHYIKYLVKSPLFFKNMANLSTGATIKNFSLKSMRNYTLPLPPLKQQKQIVEVLDGLQKQTQSLESKYQQELNSLEELKKSILQKAFEGEL